MKLVSCRLLSVLILLGPLVGLVPLAYADPPDQTWIGGIYDDDDYDDVIVIAYSINAPYESRPVLGIVPVTIVLAVFCFIGAEPPACSTITAFQTRAPPIC